MFANFSMAGTGLYILLLNLFFQGLGLLGVHINVLPAQVEEWANAISALVGMVLLVIGQVRRPDLVAGIIRLRRRN